MSDKHTIKGIVDSQSQYGIKIKGQNNDEWLNWLKEEKRPKDKPYEKPEKGDMVEIEWEKREGWKNAYINWCRIMSKREALGASGAGGGGGEAARLPWGYSSIAEYKYALAQKDTDILYSVCLKSGTDVVVGILQSGDATVKGKSNQEIAEMISSLAYHLFLNYMERRPECTDIIIGFQARATGAGPGEPEGEEPG